MRTALNLLRWLLLIPAYQLCMAIGAVWVLEFFTNCPGLWRAHFDLVMFSCWALMSIGLCLLSALIAPSIKRSIGALAALASVALSLNRRSFVLFTVGWTRPMVEELGADIVGGLLACLGLVLIHAAWMKRAENLPSF